VLSRLPLAAFGALVVATVGAFFVTQHLKVLTPLINGSPKPSPSTISPGETGCGGKYRSAAFSFYLQHRADDVAVYIVDQNATIIRTLASGRHMRRGVRFPDGSFPWNGREDNGTIAPDGTYYYRIALLHQGRTIELTKTPVVVKTTPPRPVVTGVSPSLIPQGGSEHVTISYQGNEKRSVVIRIYRTDLPPGPRLVKSFVTSRRATTARWDGKIHLRPAPAGTYLVGVDVTDKACNTGSFPVTIPPPRGSTAHAGVTVRYLAAQPPLDPVPAGSSTTVYVDSRQRPYRWALRRAGADKVLAHGSGQAVGLRVRLPPRGAGLYELALRSGPHRTLVPLVASAASRGGRRAKLLVVLPAVTWQGENPVDDDDDGLPNTLEAGTPVSLERPFAHGLPSGFADEAALLAYLDSAHLAYDLTTDLGLISGTGPLLSGHRGVVLAGSERWLPVTLGSALRSYVRAGGHVLSLGLDALLRGVTVRVSAQGETALDPTSPAGADIFGAQPGALVAHSRELIIVTEDRLGIFSTTSGAFPGFSSFQPFASVVSPGGQIASAAGTSRSTSSIVGFPIGRGFVVEIGLPGLGASLVRNTDTQELVARLWTVMSG
jgi:hypothetical protein